MKTSASNLFILVSIATLLIGFLSPALALPVVSEKIFFLNEDGENYVRYDTTRTSHQSYDIWFNEKNYKNPEKHLQNYLYLYPYEHNWDRDSQADFDLMKIASGSFASLVQDKLDINKEINIGEDGVYTYSNWDGKTRTPDNHYGIWNKPEDFSQLVYAWVFPQNLNIISYKSNRPGKWVKRNNTITYYGDNVNDLVFTIKYQPDTNSMYKELLNEITRPGEGYEQVQLKQNSRGVIITLTATVLFSSGSAELSDIGKTILKRLARSLSKRDDLKFIVEGHSDNVAIKGELAKKFRTNWELSSARSLKVLHYLADHGVPETRLEARAHSANNPVASNDSQQGRAKNRRIEIVLIKDDN